MKKLTILLMLIASAFLLSAKAPIKYGKITKEMLTMSSYNLDSTASAVILCDYGEFDPEMFEFTRTVRIKILKKDGLDYANWNFPTSEKSMIKGITFNLVDGKIEETKVDKKEDVYRERVYEDNYRIRLTMPNVKVGSVLDIEYTIQGLPNIWYFQYQIPVAHSELIIYDNKYINYSKNYYGFEQLDINTDYRWVMTDVPAFIKEPYINNYLNYVSKYEIEITSVQIPEQNYYKYYATSWDAIYTTLKKSSSFGGKFEGNFFLKDIADEINASATTDEEKIKAAVKEIKKVKWNESKRLTCSPNSLNELYKKKLGNSADLNIMLIELLEDLDFDVKPVVMSTRDNGILSRVFPSLNKLNYVIAYVKTADKEYFLDATDKYIDPLMLPVHCLNYQGRILTETLNDWVNIKPNNSYSKKLIYNLEMDSTGTIEGKMQCQMGGYAAQNLRKKYYSFPSEEDYLIDFEKKHSNFVIKSSEFKGLEDLEQDIEETYSFKIDSRGSFVGSMFLLNPLFEEQLSENPFKIEDRKYPVDFVYPHSTTLILTLKLPNNAVIEELPTPTRLVMPNKSITCLYNVAQMGNNIQLMYKFDINKTIFIESEYQYLKQFYSALVQKHAENIIIKLQTQEDTAKL